MPFNPRNVIMLLFYTFYLPQTPFTNEEREVKEKIEQNRYNITNVQCNKCTVQVYEKKFKIEEDSLNLQNAFDIPKTEAIIDEGR